LTSSFGAVISTNNLLWSDSGVANITLQATNIGSDIAYNVNFTFALGELLTLIPSSVSVPYSISGSNITFYTGFYLPPGTPLTLPMAFNFAALPSNESTDSSRTFIYGATSLMDLTEVPGQDGVAQQLDQALQYNLVAPLPATLTGKQKKDDVQLTTTAKIPASNEYRYVFWRKDLNFKNSPHPENQWYLIANQTSNTYLDSVGTQMWPRIDYMCQIILLPTGYLVATTNTYLYDPAPWWLAIAIAVPLAVALLALLIAAFIWARKKRPQWFERAPKKYTTKNPKTKGAAADGAAAAAAATDDTNDPKKGKQYTVNIDYIMTGAKRVQVKDGNPTSPKPPDGYEEDEMDVEGNSGSNGNRPRFAQGRPWYKKLFSCIP